MRATFRKQALGDRPHPPCTTHPGSRTGRSGVVPPSGRRGLGWGPGPLISSLTGLPLLASPLPVYRRFQLLPAPPEASCHWYLGSWACPVWWAALGHVFVGHTDTHPDQKLPGTRRGTSQGCPQPALRRAVQALKLGPSVSCLLFFPHSALNLPVGLISPGRPRPGDWGVLHPGTSGLRPVVD